MISFIIRCRNYGNRGFDNEKSLKIPPHFLNKINAHHSLVAVIGDFLLKIVRNIRRTRHELG